MLTFEGLASQLIDEHEAFISHSREEAWAYFDPANDVANGRSVGDSSLDECVAAAEQFIELNLFSNLRCMTCPSACIQRACVVYRMNSPNCDLASMASVTYCLWLGWRLNDRVAFGEAFTPSLIPPFPALANNIPGAEPFNGWDSGELFAWLLVCFKPFLDRKSVV